MKTFKVIAALLHYPDEQLQAAADDMVEVLESEGLLGIRTRERITVLIRKLAAQDLLEAQEQYVDTFDRGRARSLYLFEHVHGESRDRGPAMVDLQREYAQHGFAIDCSELPDYVPMFLEFCSALEPPEAVAWLEEVGHLLELLHARLVSHESRYAVLLEPLLVLADRPVGDQTMRDMVAHEERDDTPEALDRVWMEAPVTFGADDAGGQQPGGGGTVKPIRWDLERPQGRSASNG